MLWADIQPDALADHQKFAFAEIVKHNPEDLLVLIKSHESYFTKIEQYTDYAIKHIVLILLRVYLHC